MAETVISEADGGRTIPLRVGDTLRAELSENPTTGFRWSVTPSDTQLLAIEDDTYQPTGGGIGGAGRRVVRLKAKDSGTTSVSFALARAWAQGTPHTHFLITATIT